MAKAACDIPRPDGSVIKEGTVLPDELVFEFESSSPQLLDCYITQNSQFFKKIGKKLVPHLEVMEKDLVEVKSLKNIKKVKDMTKKELDKHAETKGIKLDRRKKKSTMLKNFKKKSKKKKK